METLRNLTWKKGGRFSTRSHDGSDKESKLVQVTSIIKVGNHKLLSWMPRKMDTWLKNGNSMLTTTWLVEKEPKKRKSLKQLLTKHLMFWKKRLENWNLNLQILMMPLDSLQISQWLLKVLNPKITHLVSFKMKLESLMIQRIIESLSLKSLMMLPLLPQSNLDLSLELHYSLILQILMMHQDFSQISLL